MADQYVERAISALHNEDSFVRIMRDSIYKAYVTGYSNGQNEIYIMAEAIIASKESQTPSNPSGAV